MISRRKILKQLTALPIIGGLMGSRWGIPVATSASNEVKKRNLIEELGLRTFINAAGNYTSMTASLMPDEVMEIINSSAKEYVLLDDVQDKVGEKIAELCRAEGAMVTAGCWSALVLGTAGVLTGKDSKKAAQLPFLEGTGMKTEVILQKSHANGYQHALTNTGVKLVIIESVEELERAISDKTAMMWFLNREAPYGQIQHEEWISIAKKHQIPTMNDIAADVPPVENLWKYNDMGFDLVAISGGKALCGPQSAGILMEKKHLIEAARLSAPPRGGNIGRGQKVNKEEILGMDVALESYLQRDHAKEWKMWEARIAVIDDAILSIPGVKTEIVIPEIANHNPSLKISWDESKIKLTGKEFGEQLRSGSPSIETISWEDDKSIRLTVFMLTKGQDKTVAKRVKEVLQLAVV
ncbi:MAG: aminotransferase class V-fold PLP-dependent enzyme [Cyclobacteriaceae bacterium]